MQICTHCGYEGKGIKQLRGSKAMEIFIWTVLMVPGPLYSAYRRMNVPRECPNCKHMTMVPLNSNAGKLMRQKIDVELGIIKPKPKITEATANSHAVTNARTDRIESVATTPTTPQTPPPPKTVIAPDEW